MIFDIEVGSRYATLLEPTRKICDSDSKSVLDTLRYSNRLIKVKKRLFEYAEGGIENGKKIYDSVSKSVLETLSYTDRLKKVKKRLFETLFNVMKTKRLM